MTVTDSGPGSTRIQEEAFEDFQSTNPEGWPRAFDLPLDRRGPGGKIQYEPAFGGGATFSFTVPLPLRCRQLGSRGMMRGIVHILDDDAAVLNRSIA